MDKIQKLKKEKEYEKYVNEKTPRHQCLAEYAQGVSAWRCNLHTWADHLSLLRIPFTEHR